MNQQSTIPKDASAVILIKNGEVLWAQRNPNLKFLGGWHAFPGGKVDAADAEIAVVNCDDNADLQRFIVAAARECFEEVGVLLVRNGDKLTGGQRASLHDDLVSGRSTFAEILADWNLYIDARDFQYAGLWTTPRFSPVRFKTRFFVAECPPKQTPYAAISEMLAPEFIAPENALRRWENSEVLISPPVLIALQEIKNSEFRIQDSGFKIQDSKNDLPTLNLKSAILNLREKSEKTGGEIDCIELNSRVTVFPLKTETLPPATHTNCFVVGRREFVVIDAAARDESEQRKLFDFVDSYIEQNYVCREIIVSHFHSDHTGGETILQKHLRDKYDLKVPIAAHEITAEILRGKVEFQREIADEEIINLTDENGANFQLKAFHAAGHARGHLCFYDETKGFLLSSDNVVSSGTVVIAPPEGDMTQYLASLERMKKLPRLRFLCGSHGAAVYDARRKIEEYIQHRLEREKQIFDAAQSGARTLSEIREKVYADLNPELFKFAEKSIAAHLAKLQIKL